MIGSIFADICGSRYEFNNISNEDFPLFNEKATYTDDSILTVATADVILDGAEYGKYYYDYAKAFPNRGYGGHFLQMVKSGSLTPYNSFGNGSAMRASPIGWACNSVEHVLEEAKRSAECTHDHREGIKGAQAASLAVYMARIGSSKQTIREAIETLGYDLARKTEDFDRTFDETCQAAIPRCMAIFTETDNYENAIRKSIAMGGDVDTIACITGGIAQAYYGMPSREIVEYVYKKLNPHLARITTAFTIKYIDSSFIQPLLVGTDGAANL